MAHTRINNDNKRIEQTSGINNDICKYVLGEPGSGTKPYYFDDPHIRMQGFGGNISENIVDVNSNLLGLTRKIDRNQPQNVYNDDSYSKISYPNMFGHITDEPRASNPAWEVRGLENNNWAYLPKDPQAYLKNKLKCNIDSRILEKSMYKPNY